MESIEKVAIKASYCTPDFVAISCPKILPLEVYKHAGLPRVLGYNVIVQVHKIDSGYLEIKSIHMFQAINHEAKIFGVWLFSPPTV